MRVRVELTPGIRAPRLAAGNLPSGEPRGYDPSAAGRGFMPRPRRGGREADEIGRPSEGGTRSGSPSELTRPAFLRGVLALAILSFAALTGISQNAGSPGGSEPGQDATMVIVVAGNAAWTDTGLEVASGDVISFEAEGKITLQRGNPEAECGPDGYDLQTMRQPLTGRNLGALIGKVVIGVTVLVNEKTKEEKQQEAAEFFYVGSKSRVEMPAKGHLFLGINENVIGDNEGEFRVTISTSAGQGAPAAPG